ncbi:EamA family transporter [Natrinema hispanicum]|uniref:Transporter family protein n=1 Tax=Natrinema hispanicum TaxID=392421 RepID=A0A1I0J6S8_9EURY|nr:EamA family transporter [Natrinema hispanicum]SDC75928.1 transporter family protein [Natrinema hispanicum]SEU05564.1 transporter family protein [Natrinema hispanicum]
MDYLLWVIVALVAYGLMAPLTSVVTSDVPPAVALFLSTTIFLCLTAVVLVVTGTGTISDVTSPSAQIVYVAGLFLSAGILAYYQALERGPVSVVVPIYGLFIVGSSIIGIAFLGEELTATRVAGIVVAAAAIYLAAGGEA